VSSPGGVLRGNEVPRRAWSLVPLWLAWPFAFGGEQLVAPTPANLPVPPGQALAFAVGYQSANPCTGSMTGLGLRMHWDSSKLALTSLTGVLATALVAQGPTEDDTADLDGDPASRRRTGSIRQGQTTIFSTGAGIERKTWSVSRMPHTPG
jgi:hypothetical protein